MGDQESKIQVQEAVRTWSVSTSSSSSNSPVSQTDENENELETQFCDTTLEAVTQHSPASEDFVKCRITRDRGSIKSYGYPTYFCYLDGAEDRKLVLTARKRKKARASTYIIATSPETLNKEHFIAKVKSNIMGTRFTCFDNGPAFNELVKPENVRREFVSVIYDQNVLGFKGPRKMTIVIPKMNNETRSRMECQPTSENMGLLGHFDECNLERITVHHNRQPMWNDSTQSYVLNFNGRVTQASVKNFQITGVDDPTETIMQFGRIKNDIFTMDYRYPLSATQAFAIALSSFDPKIACE